MKRRLLAILIFAATSVSFAVLAQTPAVTVFEGARLITGDASAPIDNSAFVVEGGRFTQVGRAGQGELLSAGARRPGPAR